MDAGAVQEDWLVRARRPRELRHGFLSSTDRCPERHFFMEGLFMHKNFSVSIELRCCSIGEEGRQQDADTSLFVAVLEPVPQKLYEKIVSDGGRLEIQETIV